MIASIILVFVLAYAAIALEHLVKVNKSAAALLGAGLMWTLFAVLGGPNDALGSSLNESLVGTAQIVFFLMGAMTIVEVVDAHVVDEAMQDEEHALVEHFALGLEAFLELVVLLELFFSHRIRCSLLPSVSWPEAAGTSR